MKKQTKFQIIKRDALSLIGFVDFMIRPGKYW